MTEQKSFPDLPLIRDRILRKAGEYFPALEGKSLRVVSCPLKQKSSYPLLLVELFGKDHLAPAASLVVKFAPVFKKNNEGLTEYQNFKRFYEKVDCRVSPLRVPRPLDFYADVNALLTEKVEGKRLSRRLLYHLHPFANSEQTQRLAEEVFRAGEWLHAYHRLTESEAVSPFSEAFSGPLIQEVKRLQAHGLSAQIAKKIFQTVDSLRDFGREVKAPVADQHGDYGPQNIHVGEGWICVFDLNYYLPNVVFDDITYFLVSLETINPFPRHPAFDRQRALALRGPFLNGYLGSDRPETEVTEILLQGYYLKNLIRQMNKQRNNMIGHYPFFGRLFDWVRTRSFCEKRLIKQCETIQRRLQGGKRTAPVF